MKYIITLLSFLVIIVSCNTGKQTNLLSEPDDIPADKYVINIDKDTTLVTKYGALLKIPKGSLASDNGNTVTLEIKEAYSIQQMMRAGLTTQSNGDPLSSGGMIYINAAAGQNVSIKQEIKIAIPTGYLEPGMQLFKGDRNDNGTINWNNPAPLPRNEQLTVAENGKQLFQSNCANCHGIGKDGTGPDLANILKRPFINVGEGSSYPDFHFRQSETYSEDQIQPVGHFQTEDSTSKFYHYPVSGVYKCNVVKKFGSVGPSSLGLKRDDILSICRYIQNESDKRNLPMPSHAYLDSCVDSCRVYVEKLNDLNQRKQIAAQKRQGLIEDNGPMVKITPDSALPPAIAAPINFDEKVSPENYDATYYQFSIESFGWFNIDMLLKEVNGVEESELFVRIVGEYKKRIKVFLIIPSAKVYGEGGPAERNPDEFAFFYKNGKLPLPQNVKAYIMAVTETESSVAFAIKEFTTGRQQQLDISLQASTKEEFEAAIQRINPERLYIGVKDSKNAGEIRQTDTEIKDIDSELKKTEGLKPKNCDCDCYPDDRPTIINTPEKDYVNK